VEKGKLREAESGSWPWPGTQGIQPELRVIIRAPQSSKQHGPASSAPARIEGSPERRKGGIEAAEADRTEQQADAQQTRSSSTQPRVSGRLRRLARFTSRHAPVARAPKNSNSYTAEPAGRLS